MPNTCLFPPRPFRTRYRQITTQLQQPRMFKAKDSRTKGKTIWLWNGACKFEAGKKSAQPPRRMREREDVQWENNQATRRSWKSKAHGNRQSEQGLPGLHNRVNGNGFTELEKGCKRCHPFCAQSVELESVAICNPKLAGNAKQTAPKAVC